MAGVRLDGPFEADKRAALKAWREKQSRVAAEREAREEAERDAREEEENRTLGDRIYHALFGVWSSPVPPKTRGHWYHELAPTTWQAYRDVFRTDLAADPVLLLRPDQITVDHLREMRARILGRVTTYERRVADTMIAGDGRLERAHRTETTARRPRSPRTADDYMRPVLKALAEAKNQAGRDLKPLKKAPPDVGRLAIEDREAFLDLLSPRPVVRRAARLMMHGVCRGEVCAIRGTDVVGSALRIERQVSPLDGGARERRELKRLRRYRTVPIPPDLAEWIAAHGPARAFDVSPAYLARCIEEPMRGTRFEGVGPHDLRRSGATWMLDAGAKISDVAAILGNDPKTVLGWYDSSSDKGKKRAADLVERGV